MTSSIEDVIITIKCAKKLEGKERIFELPKSALVRAPSFAKFFLSEQCRVHCPLELTFPNEPAVCFEIITNYLKEGPDMYTKLRLRVFTTIHFKADEKFGILIRTYKLAKKMGLQILQSMAYEELEYADHLMTPSTTVNVTSLIYGKMAGHDKILKKWCMKQMSRHCYDLNDHPGWQGLLNDLGGEVAQNWQQLFRSNCLVIEPIDAELELEERLNQLPSHLCTAVILALEKTFNEDEDIPDPPAYISAEKITKTLPDSTTKAERRKSMSSVTHLLTHTPQKPDTSVSDNDWEKIPPMTGRRASTQSAPICNATPKALAMLGASAAEVAVGNINGKASSSASSNDSAWMGAPRRSSAANGNEKARQLLGIDMGNGGVNGVGIKKQPTVLRRMTKFIRQETASST